MSFLGYRRSDGRVGTRNIVGIISLVSCANDVCWEINRKVEGTSVFLHGQGCCQTKPDIEIVTRTLISLSLNPNLAGVLFVSLGCESIDLDRILVEIDKNDKAVDHIVIQKLGGFSNAVKSGIDIARKIVEKTSSIKREKCTYSDLVIGIKCGASDTTSGLISNPAVGNLCDLALEKNATCVFGETTEFIGAEHILSNRARTPEIGKKIIEIVNNMENRAKAMRFDMRGSQPTKGNIKGGLSTIEEKSLGAIVKSGTKKIDQVYEYGQTINNKGLFIVDTPGREPEFLTALGAAGANIILFTTGLGAPQGFPFIPVIKITGNYYTYKNLREHIDIFINFKEKNFTFKKAANDLFEDIIKIASGRRTKAEIINYCRFPNIYTLGPVI